MLLKAIAVTGCFLFTTILASMASNESLLFNSESEEFPNRSSDNKTFRVEPLNHFNPVRNFTDHNGCKAGQRRAMFDLYKADLSRLLEAESKGERKSILERFFLDAMDSEKGWQEFERMAKPLANDKNDINQQRQIFKLHKGDFEDLYFNTGAELVQLYKDLQVIQVRERKALCDAKGFSSLDDVYKAVAAALFAGTSKSKLDSFKKVPLTTRELRQTRYLQRYHFKGNPKTEWSTFLSLVNCELVQRQSAGKTRR